MPVWKYNDKCYLTNNDKKVTGYAIDTSKIDGDIEVIDFTKYMPYIFDLTCYIYIYMRLKKKFSKDIQFLKIIKSIKTIIYNGVIITQFNY